MTSGFRVRWSFGVSEQQKKGVIRESNPRPPAPEAGIIPLDQSPFMYVSTAFVAQWIEHQTSNLGVAGSSPAGGTYFYSLRGCSSDGRARALHARGTGIDTLLLHFFWGRRTPPPEGSGFAPLPEMTKASESHPRRKFE